MFCSQRSSYIDQTSAFCHFCSVKNTVVYFHLRHSVTILCFRRRNLDLRPAGSPCPHRPQDSPSAGSPQRARGRTSLRACAWRATLPHEALRALQGSRARATQPPFQRVIFNIRTTNLILWFHFNTANLRFCSKKTLRLRAYTYSAYLSKNRIEKEGKSVKRFPLVIVKYHRFILIIHKNSFHYLQ